MTASSGERACRRQKTTGRGRTTRRKTPFLRSSRGDVNTETEKSHDDGPSERGRTDADEIIRNELFHRIFVALRNRKRLN